MNIRIKDIEIYHPNRSVSNDYFLNHFDKQKKDIRRLLRSMGRKKRYLINNDKENSLTMAVKASKKVLEKSGIKGEEIGMIIFSSQTPEYLIPTNSIVIHNEIGGRGDCRCFDLNSNCSGMLMALDQAYRYMLSNDRIKYTLVVGSDNKIVHSRKDDEICFPNYGDASCAVILERAQEKGFIDSRVYTDSSECSNITFPACGLSKMYDKPSNKVKMNWIPFDGRNCLEPAERDIRTLLEENKVGVGEVGAFCFSQFSKSNIDLLCERLGIDEDKAIYIGDEFGYTGTSSPLIAFYKGVESGRIKRGDKVIFWTVGGGWQIISILMEY